MNKNKLLSLLAIAALLISIAIFLPNIGEQTEEQSTSLFPELKAKLNDLTEVRVETGDGKLFTLQRQGEQWLLVERKNYPANITALRQLLLTLADLEVSEEKTANEKYYARLGVQDVEQTEDEQVREIEVKAGDTSLVHVIVGKTDAGGNSYVRKVGDAQTWLVSARVDVPARANAWLNTELLDVGKARIRQVNVTPADGQSYLLETTTPNGEFVLQNQESANQVQTTKLDRIARALDKLVLEDIATAEQIAALPEKWNSARYQTFDGLIVDVRNLSADDTLYLQLSAVYDPAAVVTPEATKTADVGEIENQTEAGSENQSDENQHADQVVAAPIVSDDSTATENLDVAAEAARLQQRFEGRTFIVANYLQDRFAEKLENLLQDPQDN